ncbi:MAG: peptide ABC transporter substrate-binding protein [Candidatus Neptunochlamydia sp.]|nr:peptide ABC transporter substrate-binding protein [Candidatus Neptunochlamydia sp.]
MRGLIRAAFFISLLAFSLTGCKKGGSSSSPSSKGSSQQITINITDDPSTLDPRKARALTDVILIRMFMDGLTRVDKDGNNALAVAKKVDISPDKKTYTFTLRDSNWSNGDPVTSHDFAYAWKKNLSPDFNAPNVNMLYVIKNAKEAKTGKLPLSLVGIETPDEKTLVVTLNHPTSYFMELIAHPVFFPVNSHVDRLNPQWADKRTTYVGNGPFSISEWKHHNAIEAKKNPQYWDHKAVKLSNIKMIMVSADIGLKMFDTNDLIWNGSPLSTIPVDAIPSLKSEERLHTVPLLATQWIRVNVEKTPFQNKNLRKALAYAIDRQAIVDHITQGNQIPATAIVPTAMKLQQKPLFIDHDLNAAQTHLDQALDELDTTANNLPVIPLLYTSSQRNHLIAQAIQNQWLKAFGIQVQLEVVESKVFFDRISKKDYILSIGSWFADFNDPINFLEVFKTKDVGTNNTNWENLNYTELLETSYCCQSDGERYTVLAKSEELLISDMPVIPIFYFTMLYMQDNRLKDVVLTAMGNIDFKWAHLE